jgi:hypothetical protein
MTSKSDQDARRNTSGGPEYGHSIRLSLQKKAQTCGQKISGEDCDSEPGRSEPALPGTGFLWEPASSLFAGTFQHIATSPGDMLIEAPNP